MAGDGFIPIRRDELTDLELLPRRFDMLAGEVRELLGVIRHQLVPAIQRLTEQSADDRRELSRLRDRVAAL